MSTNDTQALTDAYALAMKHGAVVFKGDALHTELCMTPTTLANIIADALASRQDQQGQAWQPTDEQITAAWDGLQNRLADEEHARAAAPSPLPLGGAP